MPSQRQEAWAEIAQLKEAEARARERMKTAPPIAEPTRAEIEAEIQERALAAADFARNHEAA